MNRKILIGVGTAIILGFLACIAFNIAVDILLFVLKIVWSILKIAVPIAAVGFIGFLVVKIIKSSGSSPQ